MLSSKEGVYTLCRRCNHKAHIAELKQDPDKGIMVCKECYSEKTHFKEELKEVRKKEITIKTKKIKYRCKWCGYKFLSNKELKYYDSCPACSKKSTLYKDIKSEDLLRNKLDE